MRIAFFGTPDFAVPSLQALLATDHEVVAVVTQPDRARTRSHSTLLPPPVKVTADDAGIPVWQPERPRGDAFLDHLRALNLDLGVVVAYGHLLRPDLLAIPRLGLVNVHASLLPRWRGAAPIHWAIKAGDARTGVSIMQLEAGLDSGGTWLQRSTPIGPIDTTGTMFERLARLGADALVEALPGIAAGTPPTPQDPAGVTLAPKLDRDAARVDWHAGAVQVSGHLRAMDPFPGAWTTHHGTDIKLFGARASAELFVARPGSMDGDGNEIVVACDTGVVRIAVVQPAGKRRMPAGDWFRGIPEAWPREFV
ncbi:MAG TPA: methionyl-tRNA formyltransferase [Gemmatimonadales bacterium]|nr:methionyl-tRNA formyltransferase [Gemmatimonadales bacterium]